jgi:hypothetical protein
MHRVRVAKLFELPEAFGAIEEWVDRVMAFDTYRAG